MITAAEFNAFVRDADEDRIEERIDEAIASHGRDTPITISCHLLPGSYASIQTVLMKYRLAGWKAVYNYDQRDGDYVSLEAT